MRPGQGGNPVAEDGGIAPLKEDAHPAPQVGDGLTFLLPRERAAPSFFTSRSAPECQQPKVPATIGRKAMPCLLHSSSAPFTFRPKAWSRAWPAVFATPGIVAASSLKGGDDGDVHRRVLTA